MNATHCLLIVDAIGNIREWMRGTQRDCKRFALALPLRRRRVGARHAMLAATRVPLPSRIRDCGKKSLKNRRRVRVIA
jgi:hypothetical protein